MTELGVDFVALADLGAIGTPETIVARSFVAEFTSPAGSAPTGTIDRRTGRSIFAGTITLAVHAELTLGTRLQAPLSLKTSFALTLTRYVIAGGTIVTVADLRAVPTPVTIWAPIGANGTHPSRCAEAFSRGRTANTIVLTPTLGFALIPVHSGRTQIIA